MPGDLRDYAEEPTDFVLASDVVEAGKFELCNLGTMDASDIPGEYPQYGTFIECIDRDGNTVWVECPRGLAQLLVDHAVDPGELFEVTAAAKGETGAWEFEIEP